MTETLEQLSSFKPLASAMVAVAIGLLLYAGGSRFLRSLERQDWLNETMARRSRAIWRWFGVGFLLLFILQVSGVSDTAWALLSAAAAAVAVGFVALWSVLSNGVCALLILVYRPFRVGDEVELLDPNGQFGVKGRVLDLNLLFTTLEEGSDEDPRLLRIPNNLFFQRVVRTREQSTPASEASA